MRSHVGCELIFDFPQTTPMIVMLNVHFSRVSDLERPDHLMINPAVPIEGYRDSFGNGCSRLVAPAGRFGLLSVAFPISPIIGRREYDGAFHTMANVPQLSDDRLAGCKTFR